MHVKDVESASLSTPTQASTSNERRGSVLVLCAQQSRGELHVSCALRIQKIQVCLPSPCKRLSATTDFPFRLQLEKILTTRYMHQFQVESICNILLSRTLDTEAGKMLCRDTVLTTCTHGTANNVAGTDYGVPRRETATSFSLVRPAR